MKHSPSILVHKISYRKIAGMVQTTLKKPITVLKDSGFEAITIPTLGFFAGFAGVALFGPMVPKFVHLLHLDPLQAGLLVSITSLTGSLLRIPFGAFAGAKGSRKPFITLLVMSILGVGGLLLLLQSDYPTHMAGTYPLLLLTGALAGSGIATFSVGATQVAKNTPTNTHGKALGIFAGIGNLAPGVFSLLLPIAVLSFGLIEAYWIWLALLAVVLAAYIFLSPKSKVLPGNSNSFSEIKRAAKHKEVWALTVLYFTSFGGFLALSAWLPLFWHTQFHLSLITAGSITLAFGVLASVFRILGGTLADKFDSILLFTIFLIGIVAISMLIAFSQNDLVVTMALVLGLGSAFGSLSGVIFRKVPSVIPKTIGGVAGIVGGIGALGGFVIPPIMGFAIKAFGASSKYSIGFSVIVFLSVIDFIALVVLSKGVSEERSILPPISRLDLQEGS